MNDEIEPSKNDTSVTTTSPALAEAELVKGLIQHGAYEIAKTFIDFIANRSKIEEEVKPDD